MDLRKICNSVIPYYDFAVIWGFRGEGPQTEAYLNGFSNAPWPTSKHNHRILHQGQPDEPMSNAIDIAPWFPDKPHIRWDNENEFIYLAGYMMMAAESMGIRIKWGGDWDGDRDLHDINKPFDLGHFERIQ